MVVRHTGNYCWENIPILAYKNEGTHFKDINRQILFEGLADVPCQLRYFEIAPGGHSTLEHHQHVHLVFILRGEGKVLIGEKIYNVKENDVLIIPPQTWHQFQAITSFPFGFLCLVNSERDRPVRPDQNDLNQLRLNPDIAEFIRS